MDNKTLQFILKMRDEASATFDKFKGHVEGNVSKLKSTFSGLGGIVAGAFSIYAIKKFIDASNEQEKASAKLGQSLRNAGVNSQEIQKEMEKYSSSLQKVTKYSDEVITGVQTMLVAMGGVTGQALKPLTKATLDLASGLNMDAVSAATLISKTIQGSEALGRYGISTKGAATESERLDIVMKAIQKRFGGFAENEGKTAAGQMDILKNSIGELQEAIGDQAKTILKELMPAFRVIVDYGAPAVISVIKALQIGFAALYNVVLLPFIAIEKGLNMLGVSSDRTFQTWFENGEKLINQYGIEIANAWNKSEEAIGDFGETSMRTSAEVEKLSGSIGDLKEQQKNLQTVLEGLDPTSQTFIDKSKELDDVETKLRLIEMQRADALKAMRGETEKYTVSLGEMLKNAKIDTMPAFKGLPKMAFAIDIKGPPPGSMNAFQKSMQDIQDKLDNIKIGNKDWIAKYKELISKQDKLNLAMMKVNQWRMAAMEGLNAVMYAISVGLMDAWVSVFGKVNSLLEILLSSFLSAIIQIKMEMLAIQLLSPGGLLSFLFHEGGTVPKAHSGMYINAPPSKEFPIIVRGGETIRTESQEASLQNSGGGAVVNVYFNAPTNEEFVAEAIEKSIRRTGLTVDKLYVNRRTRLQFG